MARSADRHNGARARACWGVGAQDRDLPDSCLIQFTKFLTHGGFPHGPSVETGPWCLGRDRAWPTAHPRGRLRPGEIRSPKRPSIFSVSSCLSLAVCGGLGFPARISACQSWRDRGSWSRPAGPEHPGPQGGAAGLWSGAWRGSPGLRRLQWGHSTCVHRCFRS